MVTLSRGQVMTVVALTLFFVAFSEWRVLHASRIRDARITATWPSSVTPEPVPMATPRATAAPSSAPTPQPTLAPTTKVPAAAERQGGTLCPETRVPTLGDALRAQLPAALRGHQAGAGEPMDADAAARVSAFQRKHRRAIFVAVSLAGINPMLDRLHLEELRWFMTSWRLITPEPIVLDLVIAYASSVATVVDMQQLGCRIPPGAPGTRQPQGRNPLDDVDLEDTEWHSVDGDAGATSQCFAFPWDGEPNSFGETTYKKMRSVSAMASPQAAWMRRQYTHIVRTDVDAFALPPLAMYYGPTPTTFITAYGSYLGGPTIDETRRRLRRAATKRNMQHHGIQPVGSTWFAPIDEAMNVSACITEVLPDIFKNDFPTNEPTGWPIWWRFTCLMYSQEVCTNHLMHDVHQFDSRLESRPTSPSSKVSMFVNKLVHVQASCKGCFNKFDFQVGAYHNLDLSPYDPESVGTFIFYCAASSSGRLDPRVRLPWHYPDVIHKYLKEQVESWEEPTEWM